MNHIMRRVAKLMALSGSSNPHEAASAMQKAQALMQEHGLSNSDILASHVEEVSTTTARASRPPAWMVGLATTVAETFGVHPIVSSGVGQAQFIFIGVKPAPEIASYAFTALRRRLTKDRLGFRNRCPGVSAYRTRKADFFAVGWVYAVKKQVSALANRKNDDEKIEAYIAKNHPQLKGTYSPRSRKATNQDADAVWAGIAAGEKVRLCPGVDGREQERLTG